MLVAAVSHQVSHQVRFAAHAGVGGGRTVAAAGDT
jgi:hypothetical protein